MSIGLTLSVVALSILVHGVSIQPLLERYERSIARKAGAKKSAQQPLTPPF